MIILKLKGVPLDLPNNIRISLNLVSPVFQMELSDTSSSFSFTLPDTDHNRRELQYYNMPMKRGSFTSYEGAVLEAGGLRFSGLLTINEGVRENGGFSARLESALRSLVPSWKERKVRELDLGGTRNIAGQTETLTKVVKLVFLQTGLAEIGVNDRTYGFYWSEGVPAATVLEKIAAEIDVDASETGVTSSYDPQNDTLELFSNSPIDIDIDTPSNQQKWELIEANDDTNFLHNEILAHMLQTVFSPKDFDYVFAPVRNDTFYDKLNPDWEEFLNQWDWNTQSFISNNDADGERWRNSAVPFPRLSYLLQQAIDYIGYRMEGDFVLTDEEFLSTYLYNNVSLDYLDGNYNRFRDTLNLKNHIHEDLTTADILRFVTNVFWLGIEPDIERKIVKFTSKQKAFDPSLQVDWREKCLVGGKIVRSTSERFGYTLTYKIDSNETSDIQNTQKTQYKSITIGGGALEVEHNFPPPIQYIGRPPYIPIGSPSFWLTPITSHKGVTSFIDIEENAVDSDNFIHRAMIFRGLQPTTTGELYPMLNSFTFDVAGGTTLGNYGLNWQKQPNNTVEIGITDFLWSKSQREGEEEVLIEQPLLLNELDMATFDFFRPYRLRTEDGEVLGVIRQMTIEIDRLGIQSTTADILRI